MGMRHERGVHLDKSQLGQIFIPPSLLSLDNSNAPKMDEAMFKRFRILLFMSSVIFTENKSTVEGVLQKV